MRKAAPEINKLYLWHQEQNSVRLLLPNLFFIPPQAVDLSVLGLWEFSHQIPQLKTIS